MLLAILLLALLAYVAAGPYLTVRAIRAALQANDANTLAGNVDFPALRASLKAQLEDRLARHLDPELPSSVIGSMALSVASGVIDGAVDAMVTPLGLGALLQGRVLWSRFDGAIGGSGLPEQPALQELRYRYESPSRFTATTWTASGAPIVLVLTRHGLHWRLSDLQLPR
ncbi:MAG: DUF2939 domain-containing protein [Luteimonas sp.]